MAAEYSERPAGDNEAVRGQILDTLADSDMWVFLTLDVTDSLDFKLRIDCHDSIDAGTLKSILEKTLAALP